MPRVLSTDEVAQIGVAVITAQSQRLATAFELTVDEHDDVLSYFNEVLARRLLPRSTREKSSAQLRARLWRYFDAGYRNGRPWGAGWYAATLLKRRARRAPWQESGHDDETGENDVPDPRGDAWDALLGRDELLREIEHEAALECGRQVARGLLERYLRGVSERDRVVLSGRADGLTYREIAARELDREPTTAEINTRVQHYRRAYVRIPPQVARAVRPLCPPPSPGGRARRRAMGG